jgi:uncharacterized protein YbjT (DUF2867 family)
MILVTTALGIIGREAVRVLLLAGQTVLAQVPDERGEAELREWLADEAVPTEGLRLLQARLDLETAPALDGVRDMLLFAPAVMGEVRRIGQLVAAAQAAGVQRIVNLSATGAHEQSPALLLRLLAAGERAVEQSGAAWAHLRYPPFLLFQNLRTQAAALQSTGLLRLPLGDRRWPMIDARDLARAAVSLLDRPATDWGRVWSLSGPAALSGEQIAERLGAAVGYPIRYEALPAALARPALLRQHMPAWLVDDALRILEETDEAPTGQLSQLVPSPLSLADFAADHAWAFARDEAEGQLQGWVKTPGGVVLETWRPDGEAVGS